jgi:cytochrome c-type biogenesis protein CcmH
VSVITRFKIIPSFVLGLIVLSCSVFAAIDTFEFNTDEERQRFRTLSEELRCPKCQNQNLAGSDAAIALDLRTQLHSMILSGKNDEQIKDYMVERYGEFVLYNPSVSPATYVLWYGPFALLFIGFIVVYFISRKRKTVLQDVEQKQASANDEIVKHQQQLQELLGKNND